MALFLLDLQIILNTGTHEHGYKSVHTTFKPDWIYVITNQLITFTGIPTFILFITQKEGVSSALFGGLFYHCNQK